MAPPPLLTRRRLLFLAIPLCALLLIGGDWSDVPPPPPPPATAFTLSPSDLPDRHRRGSQQLPPLFGTGRLPAQALPRPTEIDFAKALAPLGPEPELAEGDEAEDRLLAEKVGRWERARVEQARAVYLQSVNRTRPLRCVEGPAAAGGPDAWRSRVDPAAEEADLSSAAAAQRAQGPRGWRLPLTEEAQQAIYKHQHPADCSRAKFLVWKMWNTGMGADLHTAGEALGWAMRTGRVLLLDQKELWWYALDREPSSLECFFAPISNCTLQDAGDVSLLLPRYKRQQLRGKRAKVLPDGQLVTAEGPRSVGNPLRLVASVRNKFSSFPNEWREWGYTWWMAQTSRYLLREPQPWLAAAYDRWVGLVFGESGPPAKLIGMHVRHGDKFKEMKLLPLAVYMKEAKQLRAADPSLRDIFISTEDDAVLAETDTYRADGWRFYWTKHLRENGGSPMDYAMKVGPSMLSEISFVNLMIQERLCTHWVGTDLSNWNRLINELRMTNAGLGRPYHQLNKKRCVGTEAEVTTNLTNFGFHKGC